MSLTALPAIPNVQLIRYYHPQFVFLFLVSSSPDTMLLGLLSDSHGRHLMVRRAIELFADLGVEHIIHCGDVCGDHVFDELAGRSLTFVWGNMDEVDAGLLAYLNVLGISAPNAVPTRLTLDDKRFAIFHGHEREFAQAERHAFSTLGVDYVLHGHTHVPRDDRLGRVRVINPGALHRARPKSVATLDTTNDRLTRHEVKDNQAF
jgi:putative phosphoesterase